MKTTQSLSIAVNVKDHINNEINSIANRLWEKKKEEFLHELERERAAIIQRLTVALYDTISFERMGQDLVIRIHKIQESK